MIKFQYQVLRYQPDKVGEEFMNLGVVVYDADKPDLRVRYLESIKRLSAFFPAGNNTYIKSLVKSIADQLEEMGARGRKELDLSGLTDLSSVTRLLLPGSDSALYFTEVKVALDLDIDRAVDNTYARMVTRYLHAEERSFTDKDVWSNVYSKHFKKYGIDKRLVKRQVQTPLELFSFDRTWSNGHMNLLESVNFDLKHEPSIREKVHKWYGKLMLLRQASEELHIYLLSKLPSDPALRSFIQEVLNETADPSMKVDLVDETKAEEKVKDLAAEMEAHG